MSSGQVQCGNPGRASTRASPWNAYFAQRTLWINYPVQLEVDVLVIVLKEIQRLHRNLTTTSLRQQRFVQRFQLILRDDQDVVVRHSGTSTTSRMAENGKTLYIANRNETGREKDRKYRWIDKQGKKNKKMDRIGKL